MRTFIYGRPAVEKGDRGYRVFKYDGLDPDEVKRIKDLFSDHDPDVRELEKSHFEPFFAWFPWRDDLWIFSKGRIEAQGRLGAMYYSYLFHGVVLDEKDRRALHFNPFILADFFDLETEKRATLPRLPRSVEEKGYHLNLMQKLRALGGGNRQLGLEAGSLVDALLAVNSRETMRFPHRGDWSGSFWGTVYFLLPRAFRRTLSLASWGPSVETRVLLCGGGNRGTDLPLKVGVKSVYSDLLIHLSAELDDEKKARRMIEIYEVAAAEIAGKAKEPGERNKFLDNLFRALERPSVRSLEDWPAVGVGLFPYKLAHMKSVWRTNRAERRHFPGLAAKIWHQIYKDYAALAQTWAEHYEKEMITLFRELKVDLSASMVGEVMDLPRLARCLTGLLDKETFIRALLYSKLRGDLFHRMMTKLDPDGRAQVIQMGFGMLYDKSDDQVLRVWQDRLTTLAEMDPHQFRLIAEPFIFSPAVGMLNLEPDSALWQHCREIWMEAVESEEARLYKELSEGRERRLSLVALAKARLTLLSRQNDSGEKYSGDEMTRFLIPNVTTK
ncbi:MAG: hypothetical protein QNK37_29560 [Acidobacteriota bacterium]|nr:hypothetical protein [Acidobacteriota bacterium]